MLDDGDDAGHCSNGLSAQNYRAASPEDRATYRAWLRGVIVFYAIFTLVSGAVVMVRSTVGSAEFTTAANPPPASNDTASVARARAARVASDK